jgi:hypothetical protein
LSEAITTAALTVFAGFVVFVLGQIVQRFVLEPIQEQRKVIGEIAHALLFYANVYRVPEAEEYERMSKERIADLEEARKTLRGFAGRLHTSLWNIPAYDTLARMGRVPKKADILTASKELVGWSNMVYGSGPSESVEKRRRVIANALGISEKVGPPG